MKDLDIRVRTRLRKAHKVAENNKKLAAAQLYRELLADEPALADAWAGLGNVLSDEGEREAAYEKALSFDAENVMAQHGLAVLRGEIVEEVEVVEEMPAFSPTTTTTTTTLPDTAPLQETHEPVATPEDEVLFCANHPNRETRLRCNKCNKPICSNCIKNTPVGYRCKQCIREQEEVFFSAEMSNYVIAAVVAIPLGFVAAYLVPLIGFFIIFLAPAVGTGIGRLTFMASGKQRGRYMPHMIAGIIAITALLAILSGFFFTVLYSFFGASSFGTLLATLASFSPGFLWGMLYAVLAASSAYYYMK